MPQYQGARYVALNLNIRPDKGPSQTKLLSLDSHLKGLETHLLFSTDRNAVLATMVMYDGSTLGSQPVCWLCLPRTYLDRLL
ncbi:hypothetical protein PILCRDRAFT_820896 [Piloderma croceum F 1598]|uniref:Uncharacterized protein n=1 Tax=Piloderma croceum (strain F 1598) TaxID=765440 RepID=A0A0C3FS65_PILCF|nr:hypothetical protein PILCRDRAFT_820896 [Piloderma croceum F 1598]